MRDFDEFVKIAKKQKYDEKDYPYGYRKGKMSIVKNAFGMAVPVGIGTGLALTPLGVFSLKIPAVAAGVGAIAGGAYGKQEGKDIRDLSWASKETQKKLKKLDVPRKAYDLGGYIQPMYERAFDKTPEAKAIRAELGKKGLSQKQIESSPMFSNAFLDFVDNSCNTQDALFQRMAKYNDRLMKEDERNGKAYDEAKEQAIAEGRRNRMEFKKSKRFWKRAELDELYFAKIAADAPDIESEKEIIPRLTQEVTYVPPEKTPPTPGGKVTPSKYVQRKNKQRYQG